MVSAGIDTVPGNIIMSVGYLSSPHGQEIQERAYQQIMKVYPNGDAWEKCLDEEKVPYVTAFVKETLRFWSVIPISLPRVSIKDIFWEKATIPAGTTFYMVGLPRLGISLKSLIISQNAYAADYDATHFESPHSFNPDRYLSSPSDLSPLESSGTPHYGYGAGSRMCVGSHLANRELYTAFLRLIFVFRIIPSKDPSDWPVLDALECSQRKTGLTTEPKPFKVRLRVRDQDRVERWMGSG